MFIITISRGHDIKKLPLEVLPPLKVLRDIIERMFRDIDPLFMLKYIDDEGDVLLITSDQDLDTAMQIITSKEKFSLTLPIVIVEGNSPIEEERTIQSVSNIMNQLDYQISNIVMSMNNFINEQEIEQKLNEAINNCSSKLSKFSSKAQEKILSIKEEVQNKSLNVKDYLSGFKEEVKKLPEKLTKSFNNSSPNLTLSEIFSKDTSTSEGSKPEDIEMEKNLKILEELNLFDRQRNIQILQEHQGEDILVVINHILETEFK